MRLQWLSLACFALPASAQSFEASYQLLPGSAPTEGGYGVAVDVGPLRQIVGAPGSSVAGALSGAAFVYDTPSGRLLHALAPEGKRPGARFGSAVAIDARRAIVGAPTDDGHAPRCGAASVHDLATGARLFRFTPKGASPDDLVGQAVAIDGRYAAIGAPGVDGVGSCYVLDAGTGELLHELRPEEAGKGDEFGGAVAISGDRLLVGSRGADVHGPDSGAAYLFDLESGEQLTTLTPWDASAYDEFGGAVALDGDRLVVGAAQDDDNGCESGSAYLFDAPSGLQLVKLRAIGGWPGDGFGSAVAISGGRVIVGAPRADAFGKSSGEAYVFDSHSGVELERLAPRDAAPQGEFGAAVALDGLQALVGAALAPVRGEQLGRAYVFEFEPLSLAGGGSCYASEVTCPCVDSASETEGCPNSSGSGASLEGSGSTSITGGGVQLFARGLPRGATGMLLRGRARLTGGAARFLGDGALCLGGEVRQVQVLRASQQGNAGFQSLAPSAVPAVGSMPLPGVAHYQLWYRDARSTCTKEGLNATNVWSVPPRP